MLVATLAVTAVDGAVGFAAKKKHKVKATVTVTLGDRSAASAGPDASISDEQAQAVLGVVKQYVKLASVQPIKKGIPAPDLSALFGAAVAPRLTGPDRSVLVDEGLPKALGNITATAQPLSLVALADQQGKVLLITAKLDLAVATKVVKKGPKLQINRTGALIFEPDGAAWKITGYDLAVTRAGGGVDAPVTSSTTSTTRTR